MPACYVHFGIGGIDVEKKEAVARNIVLRDKDGNKIGVFSGKSPRQAGRKAANRGYTDIRLRESGTKKVHLFQGEMVQANRPKNAPAWTPDRIWNLRQRSWASRSWKSSDSWWSI